jgi:pimeloyl-ACP methyl ester carboxylesterase
MASFVLVHGGCHGGWCWKRVSPLLRQAGHEVFAVTLTGLGERKHLASPDVTLETHIQDVLGVFRYEDLHDVILVGHSLGGMVISGVADTIPERIAHLVYLDASVPLSGESALDIVGEPMATKLRSEARIGGAGWMKPPGAPQDYGVMNPDDAAWLSSMLTPQPLATYSDQLILEGKAEGLPKTFIRCTEEAFAGAMKSQRHIRQERARGLGWNMLEIATGHDAMVTAPNALARLLVGLTS